MELPSFSGTEGLEELAMTRSLPGAPAPQLAAGGWASRLQSAATTVGLKVIPWVPTRAKRLLSGGRAVTIDGNTLDPTLQLALAGTAHVRVERLGPGAGRRAASRAQMREMTLGFAGPQIHVGVSEVSIPGPAGPIPPVTTARRHPTRRPWSSSTTAVAGCSATSTPTTRCAG